MFIGREYELQELNNRYQRKTFEFLPFYGRRRVGKTALIKEFIKDKKAIFYTATESGKNQNLRGLSSAIFETMTGNVTDISYNSYEAALDAVLEQSKKERTVFVIDEYPYLVQSYKAISSILQKYIDLKYKDTDLFIILCGSSMSFMEYQVLGYKSPLYGRRTGQFKIEPFGFYESLQFHTNFSREEQAIIYGLTGGIPRYLEIINDKLSLKDNIISSFLKADAMLFEEPANLLNQELREPHTYNDIITAIAGGASKQSEIVTKSNIEGFDSSKCNKYLGALISLRIVKKEQSILTANSKKSIYRLNDSMFRFWYRFVTGNIARIHLGHSEEIYKNIEPYISDFMGEVFEEICKQWIWRKNSAQDLPFSIQDCGRWWGTNPIKKAEQEIDIIAFDDNSKAIFCECKWSNEKVDNRVLKSLIDKSNMFDFNEKYYYLFSKSGFKSDIKQNTEKNIRLIEFIDMC